MSVIDTMKSRTSRPAREQLHDGVRLTAQRGRLVASLSVFLLCGAALVGGLFLLAIKDVVFVLPGAVRMVLLLLLLSGVLITALIRTTRHWFNPGFQRAAGEQIDDAAQVKGQPVTTGLSLNGAMDDDTLALMLLERAEARAAAVSASVKPGRAYPLRLLLHPGSWLLQAVGLWLLLAIIVPSQVLAIASRVLMPWNHAPPFSLTQLAPQWTPAPPQAGDNVTVTVEPSGLEPESVAWVRLDERGDEAERFEMIADGQGGFRLVLKRVESPIEFKLEANGRYTRIYTITPTPREITATEESQGTAEDTPDVRDSATTFDPDKVARRDLEAHRDWPGLKAKLQKLLDELGDAERLAQSIDPADGEALANLADKLAELASQGKKIADAISEMQGDLPAEAAALLEAMQTALANMQTAALPAPPDQASSAPGSGEPTPAQWLKDASDAAKADQEQIGQGLGPSDQPTESGTFSGEPGDGPDLRDPSATGTSTQQNLSGDDGPLPDSVMQQVPPSYRDFVSAYFEKLADE